MEVEGETRFTWTSFEKILVVWARLVESLVAACLKFVWFWFPKWSCNGGDSETCWLCWWRKTFLVSSILCCNSSNCKRIELKVEIYRHFQPWPILGLLIWPSKVSIPSPPNSNSSLVVHPCMSSAAQPARTIVFPPLAPLIAPTRSGTLLGEGVNFCASSCHGKILLLRTFLYAKRAEKKVGTRREKQ